MEEDKKVEITTKPEFVESVTIRQNAYSNGTIVTFIDELKLKLDDNWAERAKTHIEKAYTLNKENQDKIKEQENR